MLPLLKTTTGRVLIEGHKGSETLFPGNTWKALEQGLASGADLLEVDVQASSDGILFLSHHYRLSDGRLVRDLGWRDIQRIDFDGHPIPRLDEVMTWASSTDVILALDVKDGLRATGQVVESLSNLLERQSATDRLLVTGWNHAILKRLKHRHPTLCTRALVRGRLVDYVHAIKSAEADAVTLSYDLLLTGDVDALHEAGIAITLGNLWEPDYEFVSASGVDIVSVSDPAEARKALRPHGSA